MKLNKTLMMAVLIAGSVFAADVAVRAQIATNPPPAGANRPDGPAARGRMNFDSIATRLVLTDDQKTKAKPVFVEMMQKMRNLRQDTSLQPADRRSKMKEIRDAATTKLKDILTAEQLDKWQKMGHGNRRRPGGDAKPPQ